MTGTTGRLRRIAAIVGIGLATAAVATGTAVAADGDGGGHHGDPPRAKGTPCTVTADSCVDLEHNQAWLIHDGKITRGPVGISHGGQGKETPTGTFHVLWKDKDHKSAEFNDAAMPYSVFFADGGIAFHQGNPKNPSAGCVHLSAADAQAWFNDLEVGDEVQVR
jgi:L,D-transpeptidase catalytic domain